MCNYLLPETGLNQEEMRTVFQMRTGMIDLPRYHPYKYGGRKVCRYGCTVEEDILHTLVCVNDGLAPNQVNKEDIEEVFKDQVGIKFKEKIHTIQKIVKSKSKEYADQLKVENGNS